MLLAGDRLLFLDHVAHLVLRMLFTVFASGRFAKAFR